MSQVSMRFLMLCRVLEHYGLEVILVTMSRAGVLLVRRGNPAEPLPRKGALRSNNRRYQRKTDCLTRLHYTVHCHKKIKFA